MTELKNEMPVLPAVIVMDASGPENRNDEIKFNEIIEKEYRSLTERSAVKTVLTLIISSKETQLFSSLPAPVHRQFPHLPCSNENHMNYALWDAMQEINWLIGRFEQYRIPYSKPRIYMLSFSKASDPDYGILKKLKLRLNRGVFDFIPVFCTDCKEDMDMFIRNEIECNQYPSDQAAAAVQFIFDDLAACIENESV